jgi:MraZ protein
MDAWLSTPYPPAGGKSWIKGLRDLAAEGYTTGVGQSGAKWGEEEPDPMFLGEYQHNVDGKGRIAIPARFRGKIEGGAVLTRGVEACLYVYPLAVWEEKARALDAAIVDPRKRRQVERRFFGMAYECELDAQGRIVIPSAFRAYAGLPANGNGAGNGHGIGNGNSGNGNGSGGEAMVIGARERFEIWSPERWQAYLAETQDDDLSALP